MTKSYLYYCLGIVILSSLFQCSPPNTVIVTLNEWPAHSKIDLPVQATITLPASYQNSEVHQLEVSLSSTDGQFEDLPGQIMPCDDSSYQVWWMLPSPDAEPSLEWTVSFAEPTTVAHPFEWKDDPMNKLDLHYEGQPIFSYSYILADTLDKATTLTTNNKPFYHIYDGTGKNKITNGPEEGVYSHHRGIMIGWRDVQFEGNEISFWGMEDLTVQKHIEFTKTITGPVFAQTEALIHWNDSTGRTIVEEKRQATIFKQGGPNLLVLDFTSTLNAVEGTIILDGDAEHGGVQFRPNNDIAEDLPGTQRPTYVFHKEGIDAHKDYNLPWVGMEFGYKDKTYSVVHFNSPNNPTPTIWSAYRDYGRFGTFFRHELVAGSPLTVNCRYWINEAAISDKTEISTMYDQYRQSLD